MGEAQTTPYGTNVYFDDYVCHSAENGMTCWSTRTGHGALLNRDVIAIF